MDEKSIWIQILTIALPAFVSVYAAFTATSSARRAKVAESDSARLRALEERVAGHKFKVYEPMIKTLGDILTPSRSTAAIKASEDTMADFQAFVAIWGSDDAVKAFFRYRISSSSNPPAVISIRLVADFIMAARRDLAWPETKITGLETLGMRINDLADHPEMVEAFSMDFDELAKKHSWQPPWNSMHGASTTR